MLGLVVKVACGIAVSYKLLSYFTPLVNVIGNSMCPTYLDGEIIPFHKVMNPQKVNIGDVVVLLNPCKDEQGHTYLIKRVYGFKFKGGYKDRVYVLGDNSGDSMDSRDFGYIPIRDVKYVAFKSRPYGGV